MRAVVPLAIYVVGEGLIAEYLASRFGWPAVLGLFVLGLVTGLLVMAEAGRRAGRTVRAAGFGANVGPDQRGTGPHAAAEQAKDLGDAGLMFVGGILLAVPGVGTDVLGLLLLVPLTRRFCRRPVYALLGSRLRRFTVTVASPSNPGSPPRNRRVPGEVIQGEVIDRRDEPFPDKSVD